VQATTTRVFGSHTAHEVFKPVARTVGIVVSEGFSLLGVGMAIEVFRVAEGFGAAGVVEAGVQGFAYQVQVLSSDGGSVTSSGAAKVWTCAIGNYLQEGASTLLVARPFEHEPYELVRGALKVVSRDFEEAVVREIAERLLPGASERLVPASGDIDAGKHKVRRGARWLAANCTRAITIDDAAAEVAMSRRNFLRRFKLEMGSTPSEFLLRARLGMASRLLSQTGLPVDKIARRCALGNGDNLAKIFRKRWSMSPTEYRSRQRRETCLIED